MVNDLLDYDDSADSILTSFLAAPPLGLIILKALFIDFLHVGACVGTIRVSRDQQM